MARSCGFFRHAASKDGISVNLAKVEAVVKWPKLTNVTDIRSFLGFARYYQRFINRFSNLAVPLTKLTRKNMKF